VTKVCAAMGRPRRGAGGGGYYINVTRSFGVCTGCFKGICAVAMTADECR
jgi:hypothetical protein